MLTNWELPLQHFNEFLCVFAYTFFAPSPNDAVKHIIIVYITRLAI